MLSGEYLEAGWGRWLPLEGLSLYMDGYSGQQSDLSVEDRSEVAARTQRLAGGKIIRTYKDLYDLMVRIGLLRDGQPVRPIVIPEDTTELSEKERLEEDELRWKSLLRGAAVEIVHVLEEDGATDLTVGLEELAKRTKLSTGEVAEALSILPWYNWSVKEEGESYCFTYVPVDELFEFIASREGEEGGYVISSLLEISQELGLPVPAVRRGVVQMVVQKEVVLNYDATACADDDCLLLQLT